MRMLNCVCRSHLPPPCLSKADTKLPIPFFSRPHFEAIEEVGQFSLMLSVNEAACIVPGVMKRRRGLHAEPEDSSSSSAAAAALAFLPPCDSKHRSHAHFQLRLRFLGQRRKGGGVHRKTLSGSGLSFYCNLCKCSALLFTPDV